MQTAGPPQDSELGRLAWRCRRGMKELDLLLRRYLTHHWPQADPAERAAFERILELPDPLLAAYLMDRETPADPHLQSLLAVLRDQAALQPVASIAAASAPGVERA